MYFNNQTTFDTNLDVYVLQVSITSEYFLNISLPTVMAQVTKKQSWHFIHYICCFLTIKYDLK